MHFHKIILIATLVSPLAAIASNDGLFFNCEESKYPSLKKELIEYLTGINISPKHYSVKTDKNGIQLTLNTPESDTNTLDFTKRPEYALITETVVIPSSKNKINKLEVVSKKEIALAMMQHGRKTVFENTACSVESLSDHINIRQNIVTWSTNLNWIWPDGGYAKWNNKYWYKGTPKNKNKLYLALNDMFMHQKWYSIGCYTATKVVVLHGVYDYYYRLKKDTSMIHKLNNRLFADNEPLVGLEPARMWYFEDDFDIKTIKNEGKILVIDDDVAANNFVPGDWTYILNTDKKTYAKIGYEGSNAIYLGNNRFDDYYNDHKNYYEYEQKLDEVYQWRNQVFSRERDAAKIEKLSDTQLYKLKQTPAEGGIQMKHRAYPYLSWF